VGVAITPTAVPRPSLTFMNCYQDILMFTPRASGMRVALSSSRPRAATGVLRATAIPPAFGARASWAFARAARRRACAARAWLGREGPALTGVGAHPRTLSGPNPDRQPAAALRVEDAFPRRRALGHRLGDLRYKGECGNPLVRVMDTAVVAHYPDATLAGRLDRRHLVMQASE